MQQHADLLIALLPRPYNTRDSARLLRELAAEGAALDAARVNADVLLAEMNPATATQLLPRYEAWLGLPDACTAGVAQTIEQRRQAAAARWTAEGGLSLPYMQQLLANAGSPNAQIQELPAPWQWRVTVPDAAVVTRLAVGRGARSRVGQPLRWWQKHPVECVLMRAKPAHTRLFFAWADAIDGGSNLDASLDAIHQFVHVTYPSFFA